MDGPKQRVRSYPKSGHRGWALRPGSSDPERIGRTSGLIRKLDVMEEIVQWPAQPLAVGPAIVCQRLKILKISFSPTHDHRWPQRVAIMQVQPSSSFGHIGSLEDETSGQPPSPPADADLSNCLSPIREDTLQLLRPNAGPVYVLCFAVAGALALGFGLGWASRSTWYGTPTVIASIAQPNTSPPRTEMKSAPKTESARKQAALGTGSNSSPKAPNLSTGSVLRSDGQTSRTAATSLPLDLPTGSIAPREPLYPAPETRPATIAGWTVRDVRGGTAILVGPDGIRSAMVGDTVPGVGQIESIVRWGNRWIVATANGLIATP